MHVYKVQTYTKLQFYTRNDLNNSNILSIVLLNEFILTR